MPITFQPPQPLAPGVSADYGATQAFEKFLPSLQEQQRLRSSTIQQGLGREQQAFEGQQNRIQQAQQSDQRFQQQLALQQMDLSQGEQLRMQRLQQGMSYVDDQVSNGSLGQDEGNDLKTQIMTQINPLQQRLARAQIQKQEAQTQQMQHVTAQQTAMQKQNEEYAAMGSDKLVSHVTYDGQPVAPDKSNLAGSFSFEKSDQNGGWQRKFHPYKPPPAQKDTSAADAIKQQQLEEKDDLTPEQWTKNHLDIVKHVDSQLIQDHTDASGNKTKKGSIDPQDRDFEIDHRMDAAGLSKPEFGKGNRTFDAYKADRRAGRVARKGGAQAPNVGGPVGQPAPAPTPAKTPEDFGAKVNEIMNKSVAQAPPPEAPKPWNEVAHTPSSIGPDKLREWYDAMTEAEDAIPWHHQLGSEANRYLSAKRQLRGPLESNRNLTIAERRKYEQTISEFENEELRKKVSPGSE